MWDKTWHIVAKLPCRNVLSQHFYVLFFPYLQPFSLAKPSKKNITPPPNIGRYGLVFNILKRVNSSLDKETKKGDKKEILRQLFARISVIIYLCAEKILLTD